MNRTSKNPTEVLFTRRIDLKDLLAGRRIVSWEICYDDTLAILATGAEDAALPFGRIVRAGGASFPSTHSERSYRAWYLRIGDSIIQETEIGTIENAFSRVQGFSDGSFLVASSRCALRDDGPDLNAAVYDRGGKIVSRFCLGDGIEHLYVSPSAQIWAGYFDEGIFGNFGWGGNRDGSFTEPIGAPGIVCFDRNGQRQWKFDDDSMADCYCMNVIDECVWSCYYDDFPVVRINHERSVDRWGNEFTGAHAMAVNGDQVALFGGYNEEKERCVLQRCGASGHMEDPLQLQLALPGTEKLDANNVKSRNASFHTVTETWYQLNIDQLKT